MCITSTFFKFQKLSITLQRLCYLTKMSTVLQIYETLRFIALVCIRQQGFINTQPLNNVGFKHKEAQEPLKQLALKAKVNTITFAFFCIFSFLKVRLRYNYPNDYHFLVDKRK